MSAALRYDPEPLPEQCDASAMPPRYREHQCPVCCGTGLGPGRVMSRYRMSVEPPDDCPACYGRNPAPDATCMWSGRLARPVLPCCRWLPARYGIPVTLAGYRRSLPLQRCEVTK